LHSCLCFLFFPPLSPPTPPLFPYTTLFRSYMTKPFSTRELVSRIKAVLRRANALSGEKTIDANGLILDPVRKRVNFGDKILEMGDRKSTRLNSSHVSISYAVFCLKKKKTGV